MNRPAAIDLRRELRCLGGFLAVLVAIAILALLLIGRAGRQPMPPPPVAENRQAIQVIVEASTPPAPPPVPAPAPAAAAPPVDTPVGALPPLQASYRQHVGFRRYASHLTHAGCRFMLRAGHQFYTIDPAAERLEPTSIDALRRGGYSPRTRVIEDEPALAWALQQARDRHPGLAAEILLLVPAIVESRLATAANQAAASHGLSLDQIRAMRGEYRESNGRLVLRLTALETAGRTIPISADLVW